MQLIHVPSLGRCYWIALIFASIFGANMGDFFADEMGLGHVYGLPVLLLIFLVVVLAEKFDSYAHEAYFWVTIIIVRTAATNIGDISHDLKLKAPLVIACLAVVLYVYIAICQFQKRMRSDRVSVHRVSQISADSRYWLTMLLAGALGTVMGDYFSFSLHLGNFNAMMILGLGVAFLLFFFRGARIALAWYYWATVVMIRAAGTAAGDLLAHRVFGLPLSTMVSGVVFIALLLVFKNRPQGPGLAGESSLP